MTMNKNKTILYCVIVALHVLTIVPHASAQTDANIVSQQSVLRLTPVYQRWSVGDNMSFAQTTVGVALYTPLGRDLGLTIRGAAAGTAGDVTDLNGLSDLLFAVNYYFDRPGLMVSCGVGLPTGKKELTQEEFETSILTSNEVFDLQAPGLGQGFVVHPGITWARSFSEKFSLGFGASFQYRGQYKPLEGYGDYDPGEEILVTGGFDARLGENSSIAADVVFTSYGTDKLDGEDVFAAGSKISVNAQFRSYFGQNELTLGGRYRTRGKNEIAYAGMMESENEKFTPDHVEFLAEYKMVLSDRVTLRAQTHARVYQESPSPFSGARLLGAGLLPEFRVSDSIIIPLRASFRTGKIKGDETLTGVEAGVGLVILL
jgi:hypothetical protein